MMERKLCKYMKKEGSTYKWPSEVEESWEAKDSIVAVVNAPEILNWRQLFVFSAKRHE